MRGFRRIKADCHSLTVAVAVAAAMARIGTALALLLLVGGAGGGVVCCVEAVGSVGRGASGRPRV